MSRSTEWNREARSRFALTGDVPRHGTGGYGIGCRCPVCRRAKSDYRRKWESQESQKAVDWDGEEHGPGDTEPERAEEHIRPPVGAPR